ncbi:hypothetical protein IJT17_03950 [bacterium]|nr:hypothetical protein [bacterium]
MDAIGSINQYGSNAQMMQSVQGNANAENSENVASASASNVQAEENVEAVGDASAVEGAEAPEAAPEINPVESTSMSAEAQEAVSGENGLGDAGQSNVAELLAGMQQQQ